MKKMLNLLALIMVLIETMARISGIAHYNAPITARTATDIKKNLLHYQMIFIKLSF